ncbi:MAG: prepilin-type N-terminal cleavage/methylation domain-containing protein, partial [Parcubacteria group bacterium]|nr:prepilin-type N-terminal cleavage/methylation domain-containing protein [Parcubacteria group bacterium]
MLKNSKKIKNRKQNGFTLIEALVAIAILTVSIAGPITIASKGLASAVFARDQITAFYLAQEAVEFIRNQRDENNIKGGNWLAGLNVCSNGSACTIDVQNNNIKNCPGDVCDVLKYDDNTNFYNYSTGDDSIFTRKV